MFIADTVSRAYGATPIGKHQAVDTFCEVAGVDSSQEFEAVHATDDVEMPRHKLSVCTQQTTAHFVV